VIGTSSLRRRAQLRAYRSDLCFKDVRGNVDTRLAKLDAGAYGALVLAGAGLERLGWSARIAQYLPPAICLPAAGQGALAVEIRSDDAPVARLVTRLDDAPTRVATTAERAFLAALAGGCQVPIGALGEVVGREVKLQGVVADLDGSTIMRDRVVGDAGEPSAVGWALAQRLRELGADAILRRGRVQATAPTPTVTGP
jgi:hydroxymethylbilane synthase